MLFFLGFLLGAWVVGVVAILVQIRLSAEIGWLKEANQRQAEMAIQDCGTIERLRDELATTAAAAIPTTKRPTMWPGR